MIRYYLLLLCLLFAPVYATSAEISGHTLPDTIVRFDTEFKLTGCGLRELLFSDIYLLGLYLRDAETDPLTISGRSTAKIFLLKVLYKGDLPEELPDLWRDPLSEELSKEYLSLLQDLYEKVDSGDVVEFSYFPDSGEIIRINEEIQIRQSTLELIPALIDLWLGESPVSGNLKRLLLNGSCS